jgi:hypothetical protein
VIEQTDEAGDEETATGGRGERTEDAGGGEERWHWAASCARVCQGRIKIPPPRVKIA